MQSDEIIHLRLSFSINVVQSLLLDSKRAPLLGLQYKAEQLETLYVYYSADLLND